MSAPPRIRPGLPSDWYFDAGQYARELEAVWYRDWIAVGRLEEIPAPGDYLVYRLGDQQVIVTRGKDGAPRAFYNTCRHRGSVLCTETRGRFRNGRIICPYHTWTYDLDGKLVATPRRVESDDFDADNYSLYPVATDTWGGFVFVCLDEHPARSLADFLGAEAEGLESWPLADMLTFQEDRKEVACNWKVFWENYEECYHCPRIHPELCKVVPLYGEGVTSHGELPGWQPADDSDRGDPSLADGMTTWTLDGRTNLPVMDGLDPAKRDRGMWFGSFPPGIFVVAHPQYARSVRVRPLSPERIELTVSWLLPPGLADSHADDIRHLTSLASLVVAQDARACELNQQGLRSRPHRQGVLVPQEVWVARFHDWLNDRLGADRSAP